MTSVDEAFIFFAMHLNSFISLLFNGMSFGKDLIIGLKNSFTIPSSKEWKDITTINPSFLIILFAISSDSLNSFSSLLIKIVNAC